MSSMLALMSVEGLLESLRKQIHGLKAECCLGCHQDVYKELCRQRSSQAQLRGRDPSRLHRGGDIFSCFDYPQGTWK